MLISNRIAVIPPIAVKSLDLGFASFMAVVKPTRMLAIIPKYPIIAGITPDITSTIENANVPTDQQIIATLNLCSFVLNMFFASLLRDSFSLLAEYCFAILSSL